MLSELLGAPGRAFAVAYQLALLEHAPDLAGLVARAAPPDGPAAALLGCPWPTTSPPPS